LRPAALVGDNQLAVDNGFIDAELGGYLLTQGAEALEDIPRREMNRQQPCSM
jgi:hypothetical protein